MMHKILPLLKLELTNLFKLLRKTKWPHRLIMYLNI